MIRNRISRYYDSRPKSFVVGTEILTPLDKFMFYPIGIEVATCPEEALQKAGIREADVEARLWEEVDPETRIEALDADLHRE